ncbi:MAG: RluA family pseudouridine synthase [Phycisphaerae bacterium]|jgi:tRNA pseudouridine32 synthase / 23S rRNA pseudouridine746 synthase|nr:RluA family pseudouridine synthase [Phycisphaerae bacterium]|tara:strand:+ start:3493 stop:4137 length:645 start_codon:yes stop_codon:yes gene_type:complete
MNFEHTPYEIPVIYRDETIVVLDKPTGLLSVPGIGVEKRDCVAVRVASAVEGARIVHRLDRDTSGVMIMANDKDSHRELSRQFQDREVQKTYEAIVFGLVNDDSGVIDLPIRKDMENRPRQCVDHEQGKPSLTNWKVLERMGDRSRLALYPKTGRSHQLRLHLREIGHPILGDDLYATSDQQSMAPRLLLHAVSLTVVHPVSLESMTFESKVPF